MKIVTLLLLFLYVAGLLIAGNHNLHLIEPEERFEFGKLYYAWLLKVGNNLGAITGNAIKLDWTPEVIITEKNLTNKSK
ncbi:hypothetical protein FJZ22_02230 [Candidatus Pacearchaeota archaeon]|nr:hypothetical protein [Candidatus Pacearchaeota archaeon]